ncbi:MAG: DUF885 domain-containing protein [Parvularculaceae bacterium]|nr:DUF885 domain-containing protein [Parvularculaceae bacterium]
MHRTWAAVAAALSMLASGATAAPGEDLDALFKAYWANEMEENPFAATGAGVETYNDRVPQASPADEARRLAEAKDFLARLDAIDAAGATESQKLSAEILRFILKHDIALAEFKVWRRPFLADSGFHQTLGQIVDQTPFRTGKDYENYLARLVALPAYLDQNIANMRQGLAEGFTQPKAIMDGVLPSFDAQVTKAAAEHPLYEPFTRMPQSIPAKARAAFARRGAETLDKSVIPAFARLRDFMRNEYAPKAADRVGSLYLPDGAAFYENRVRFYTSRDTATAEEIHQLGLKEVARIRKEMDAVIKKSGFKGTFAEFQNFLRTDPQFYAKTPEELLMRAAWLAKSVDGKLPGYFGVLPRQPYSVQPVPAAIAPNYTSGRYSGAAPGGVRGGEYWVNTYALDKRPLYELPALTLHEAVPGHHLQNALAYEIKDAPDFRKDFYLSAFGEGWGLYSEKLGVEMGMYATPFDDFGRLSFEMWRACRLVIDTGLHAKGWTREQAIDYLAGNTALSLHNVRTEVDRYIAWPGQALAYKVGELTIWRLRDKAEKALGPKFDLRAFHDVVLDEGSLPLDILERRVDAYIAREKAK